MMILENKHSGLKIHVRKLKTRLSAKKSENDAGLSFETIMNTALKRQFSANIVIISVACFTLAQFDLENARSQSIFW